MTSIVERFSADTWEHNGVECAIVSHESRGFRNGYVRLPEEHELLDREYLDEVCDVHGGITYGPDADHWIGFDTCHSGDFWPGLPDPLGMREFDAGQPHSVEWTVEKLRAEVERLAGQVAS